MSNLPVSNPKSQSITNTISSDEQKIREIKVYLENNQHKIADACLTGIDPARLVRTTLLMLNSRNFRTVSSTGKSVLYCTPNSILRAVCDCARIGLDPTFGRGYLIPYGNEAEFSISYIGMIELAKRSGEIVSLTAELVHEGDLFEVELGSNPRFCHKPSFGGNGNEFKLVYAIAKFADGHFEYAVLTRQDVEQIRRKSKAPSSLAWADFYSEMAKKCAVRRLCKTLPLSLEVKDAIQNDDMKHFVMNRDKTELPQNKHTSSSKLDEVLGISKPQVIDVQPETPAETETETDEDDPEWFAKESAKLEAKNKQL